jgi:hypothetical protein
VILVLILEETQELITTLGQRNGSHIFKEEKPDVPEAVIQEAVPKICRFQLRKDPYSNAQQNFKKSAMVTSAIGPMRLLRVSQVGKFSMKTRS